MKYSNQIIISSSSKSKDFDLNSKFFPTLIESQCLSSDELEKNRKKFEQEQAFLKKKKVVFKTPNVIIGRRFKTCQFRRNYQSQKRYSTRVFVNENYIKTEFAHLKEELVMSIMSLQQRIKDVKDQIDANELREKERLQQLELQNQSMFTIYEFQPGQLWKGSERFSSDEDQQSTSTSSPPTSRAPSSSSGVWSPSSISSEDFNNESGPSKWIIIENLREDVDISGLFTICLQHGSIDYFNFYQKHGVAICKYFSHFHALSASQGIHKCVIHNKVVSSKSPSDYEMKLLLDFVL